MTEGFSQPPTAASNDAVIASIRANIVFEKMIVSVLTVAAVAGLGHFLIGLGGRIIGGALSPGGAMKALFDAIGFSSLFFLAGFATAAAVGIPLFRRLEHAKIRKTWPFVLAGLVVSLIILAAIGVSPSVEAPARALYLVPGIAAALLFGRKMRPFWRAADRADAAAPVIIQLH